MNSPALTPSQPRRIEYFITLVSLLLLVLAGAVLQFPYGTDQAIFALTAQRMLEGAALYREAWDIKPPGIFFIYGIAHTVAGEAFWGIRALEVAFYALAVGMFSSIACQLSISRKAGIIGGAILLQSVAAAGYWHTALVESFAGVMVIATAWLILPLWLNPASARPMHVRLALAGLLTGYCAILKPFYVLPGLVALAFIVGGPPHTPLKPLLSRIAIFMSAASIVVGLTMLYLMLTGGWNDFLQTLLVIAPVLASSGENESATLLDALVRSAFMAFSDLSNLLLPGVALLLCSSKGLPRRIAAAFAAILASLCVGVAIQRKFYAGHLQILLPFLSCLAGMGWWRLYDWASRTRYGSSWVAAVFLALFFTRTGNEFREKTNWWATGLDIYTELVGSTPADRYHGWYQQEGWPTTHAQSQDMAQWITARTAAGDRIEVFGFDPLIYTYSGRKAASSMLTILPLRFTATQANYQFRYISELRRNPPAIFITLRNDAMPWMIDNSLSSADTLRSCRSVYDFIQQNYKRVKRDANYEIFMPNDSATSAPTVRVSPADAQ